MREWHCGYEIWYHNTYRIYPSYSYSVRWLPLSNEMYLRENDFIFVIIICKVSRNNRRIPETRLYIYTPHSIKFRLQGHSPIYTLNCTLRHYWQNLSEIRFYPLIDIKDDTYPIQTSIFLRMNDTAIIQLWILICLSKYLKYLGHILLTIAYTEPTKKNINLHILLAQNSVAFLKRSHRQINWKLNKSKLTINVKNSSKVVRDSEFFRFTFIEEFQWMVYSGWKWFLALFF